MKDCVSFSTLVLTLAMFPIISSTAELASVTPCDWFKIIASNESMLLDIWVTPLEVDCTLWLCSLMLTLTASMFFTISSMPRSASEIPASKSVSTVERLSFESLILETMSWSFATKSLNPLTTWPISLFVLESRRFVRSAFPLAMSSIAETTPRKGLIVK